uniref:Nuclear protein UL24 n=1 Tax=Wood mouse herpesvirus TaxID=432370 RepID=D0PPA9_9GAMA|nr:nuclear protein UL24 [Wood mouse herpesvirus]
MDEKGAKQLLNKLPKRRARAGKLAHVRCYRAMQGASNILQLLESLKIAHQITHPVGSRLFFEVTLGRRVVDAIVVVFSESSPHIHCFLIELKTCKINFFNHNSTTREAQRVEGSSQLRDSARALTLLAPVGTDPCRVTAHLIFKSQRGLHTLKSYTLTWMTHTINTKKVALLNFLGLNADNELRACLTKGLPPARSLGRRSHVCLLDPKPPKHLKNRRRGASRNQKARRQGVGPKVSHDKTGNAPAHAAGRAG